ncbi:MAG: hypothetical protein IJC59_05400 [Lachnospiraceae bacterium]|nr:hypothetical protein [Lachnospiraceae bacterium]
MKNTKLYPFERNRYYPGKMLASADFQAEQVYFNSKRRFINNLMYGSGVVCGLGVFNLDDLSLMIESGVAIDGMGREIIIETSVVKKLSSLDGFDTLQSNRALLCLRYQEEEVHTVYTMNQGVGEDGREYEYNRISEGYQLFLMDADQDPEEYMMETEFLTQAELMVTDDYLVRVLIPSSVSKGRNVKIVLEAEKLSDAQKRLTYHGVLQMPVFLSARREHELAVELEDVLLSFGEKLTKEYWVFVEDVPSNETSIVLKADSARGYVDHTAAPVMAGFSLNVLLSGETPRTLVNHAIGHMSLEIRNIGDVKDYIRLANLRLVRTDSAYLIEEIQEKEVKKYVIAPAQEGLRNQYLEYFEKEVDILVSTPGTDIKSDAAGEERLKERKPEFASGILEVPLGESARKGDIRYSGEIMHGLGPGNVYVEIGYEYITSDEARGSDVKNTIYGNPELFRAENTIGVDAETAVKVLNDKGSFIVAAKLLRNIDQLVLTYRWVAIRFPAGADIELEEKYKDISITTDTPTVVLGVRESHYFQVRFNNMESCSIMYELTEPGSGEITSDGVYTAPSREGVYEIRMYCVEMPVICTYAYAIVKKRGAQESLE